MQLWCILWRTLRRLHFHVLNKFAVIFTGIIISRAIAASTGCWRVRFYLQRRTVFVKRTNFWRTISAFRRTRCTARAWHPHWTIPHCRSWCRARNRLMIRWTSRASTRRRLSSRNRRPMRPSASLALSGCWSSSCSRTERSKRQIYFCYYTVVVDLNKTLYIQQTNWHTFVCK